jgi:hypothetical protein
MSEENRKKRQKIENAAKGLSGLYGQKRKKSFLYKFMKI